VPDPTVPGALDELAARVTSEKAAAGLAYDGDGDRLAMVDELGRPVYADRLLTLLAKEALISQPGAAIVYELSCTQALPEIVKALGGKAVSCPVGYAFVHEAMRTNEAILGGETAGHLFFGDPVFQFDDALLATAKMISLIARSAEPLSTHLARLPQYHGSPQRRFYCPDAIKTDVVAVVRDQFLEQGYKVIALDGAKISFGSGWALFRASNTQPAVTLHCEATTVVALNAIEDAMLRAIARAAASLGVQLDHAH
jgi:phosphomannomutase/phosphoglucomutase